MNFSPSKDDLQRVLPLPVDPIRLYCGNTTSNARQNAMLLFLRLYVLLDTIASQTTLHISCSHMVSVLWQILSREMLTLFTLGVLYCKVTITVFAILFLDPASEFHQKTH